jgi:single-strand DNA-binding protein
MNTLIGNLTRDPELRFTPSGKAVVNFGLAVNQRAKVDGKWVDVGADFHDVVAWQDLAEHVEESLSKGQRVIVHGDFKERSWEGEDGQQRTKREFVAQDVGLSLRFRVVR